jgi:pimeloyl-ACP methyl ester carboxylesterase
MEGTRYSVVGDDGVDIGLVTAGVGPPLLLVHGGMGSLGSWAPLWDALTARRRVTAMDRRGRGSSGDSEPYALTKEYRDVTSVASSLAPDGGSIDVFGFSYGATCVLGAAATGAPFRRVALYEPPGPQCVSEEWIDRVTALIAAGKPGRAMFSFVTEIVGLTAKQFEEYRAAPAAYDILPIVSATMLREARALVKVDPDALAEKADVPVLLLLGATSPPWAGEITRSLAAALSDARVAGIAGCGHDAIDTVPQVVVDELLSFFEIDSRSGI